MRLGGLVNKSRDQCLIEAYNEVLNTIEETVIIEVVKKEPIVVQCLPHRLVVKKFNYCN